MKDNSFNELILGGITLAQYAEIKANIIHFRAVDEAHLMSALRLNVERWRQAETEWSLAIERDLEAHRDELVVAYAEHFSESRARLEKHSPSIDDIVAIDLQESPVTVPKTVAPAVHPEPSITNISIGSSAAISGPAELDETLEISALSIEDFALPFSGDSSGAPPPSAAAQSRDEQTMSGQTSMIDASAIKKIATPFGQTSEAAAAGRSAAARRTGAMDLRSLQNAPFPFVDGDGSAPPAITDELPLNTDVGETQAVSIKDIGTADLPFGSHTDLDSTLSLQQYASLCAEIDSGTDDRTSVLLRYGISSPRSLKAIHEDWRSRFGMDPELHAEWKYLFNSYRGWLRRTND